MANTAFQELYNDFLNSIQDYRIKNIFTTDVDAAEDLLETFLLKSVPDFKNCIKNLANVDRTNKTFNVELDLDEFNIITDLMVVRWMNWSIQNITQMELTLDDTDYKHYSEERNLSGKTNYRNISREIADQEMLDYGLKHTPFKDWAVGNFGL